MIQALISRIVHNTIQPLERKKVGKFKDECSGKEMDEFVGLRAKMYIFTTNGKETKKAKEIKKAVAK